MRKKLKSFTNRQVTVFTPYSHALGGIVKSFKNDILELYSSVSVSENITYIPFDKIVAITLNK